MRKMLSVVEVFATVQGEGSLSGTPAVFVRLAGCNLWNGRDADRNGGRGECAAWCDTIFHTGERTSVTALLSRIEAAHDGAGMLEPLIVFTGGEPMLQLRRDAGIEALARCRAAGMRTAIETNGTIALGAVEQLVDHITVSPKPIRYEPGLAHVEQRTGTDLKVVVPTPFTESELRSLAVGFDHAFVQPMDVDGDNGREAVSGAVAQANRMGWRLSTQTHKHLGLP